MPLLNLDAVDNVSPFQIRGQGALPAAPEAEDSSLWDITTAAFRQENIIGSALTWADHRGAYGQVEEGFDPWTSIAGTDYERHSDRFAWVSSRAEAEALKGQIDLEEADRRTLASGGAYGFVASMVAGVLDPTVLLPGGAVVRGAKMTYSIGRSAVAGALAVGAGVALQEGILQATQELRTPEESAIAIGSSVLLGGLIGGGAAGLLSRAERRSMENVVDTLHGGPPPARVASDAGAAAVDEPTLADLTIAGKAAQVWSGATGWLMPGVRANQRLSPRARSVAQELVETTLYQGMHAEGRSLGAAAETSAVRVANARLIAATKATASIYKSMRQAGTNLPKAEFEQAVGRAMRRADEDANPFVAQAAKAWREKVIQPFTDEAVALGQLPADVAVTTAESYFNRVWNRERLVREEPRFKETTRQWAQDRLLADFASDRESLAQRIAALEEDAADLRLSPDDRVRRMGEMEAEAEALDSLNLDQVDRVSTINDLRKQKAAAKEAGQPVEPFDDQIKRVTTEGGEGLKQYLRERSRLRKRYRSTDLGYAGVKSRQDKLADSLDGIREGNEKSLNRLIAKGKQLQREAQRLAPEKFAERVSALRDQFAAAATTAEKSVERLTKMREKLDAEVAEGKAVDAAGAADRIDKELRIQTSRAERMSTLAERLEAAEALDPGAIMREVVDSADQLVRDVSDLALARGEKMQRLKDRAARFTNDMVDARLKGIEQLRAKTEGRFHQRWSTRTLDDVFNGKTPDFRDAAQEIADDVFDKLTGRGHGDGSAMPEFMSPITRGPLKDRTFNIPDHLIEDFLESDASIAMERFARTMSGELELVRRFGRADMADQIQAIKTDYKDLRAALDPTDPKLGDKLKQLTDDEGGALHDLQSMRDLLRGTYKMADHSSDFGRFTRSALHFQYLTKMGGVVIASLGELYRPAMVHGLRAYVGEGLIPLLTNLKGIKAAVEEGQLAGLVGERWMHSRLMSVADVTDPFVRGNAVEKLLAGASRFATKWNGIGLFTDGSQALATVMSQNRVLKAAMAGGRMKAADKRLLAMLGIDGGMTERIAAQFDAFGKNLDGVRVAGTEDWTDDAARRAFRDAIAKDVNSIVVRPGIGDKPLFVNTPLGKLILQFRSYALAANQRVLLRGLQEDKRRFVQGLVAMSIFGMMVSAMRSWRGGEDRWQKFLKAAENPGFLLGEGLDNSGIFTLPFEAANTVEKLSNLAGTSVNPIKSPMKAAFPGASQAGASSRFANRDPLAGILGPTVGSGVDALVGVGGGAVNLSKGEPVSDAQWRAMLRQVPFNSYLGMRELIQAPLGDSPYLSTQGEQGAENERQRQ